MRQRCTVTSCIFFSVLQRQVLMCLEFPALISFVICLILFPLEVPRVYSADSVFKLRTEWNILMPKHVSSFLLSLISIASTLLLCRKYKTQILQSNQNWWVHGEWTQYWDFVAKRSNVYIWINVYLHLWWTSWQNYWKTKKRTKKGN